MVESWAKSVGERAKVPSFEDILRDPKQNAYFSAMVRATLRGDGAGDATIMTSRTNSETVDRATLRTALAKIQIRSISTETVGKKGGASMNEGEPLTPEERNALLPFFTAYQRATASAETLDKQFKKEELHAIINWAGNNSPEMSALLMRTGNNTEIFSEALKSIAFSNPELFATLAGQLEHARRIARKDTELISKLKVIGNKHGIPMPDLLDAVNTASNTKDARRNIQDLITNQMTGVWFAPLRARLSVFGVDAFGALTRYKARDSERSEVLTEESESLAESLLRTIQADPNDPALERESGTFAEAFDRMLAGPKTPTDHEVTKQRLAQTREVVSNHVKDQTSVTALLTSKYRAAGNSRHIDDALWNSHTDDASAEEIARTMLEGEYEDAFATNGTNSESGIFSKLWGWLFDSKRIRGSLYSEPDVKKLAGIIKTAP